jgi:threonine/homoserine/homoserine lactone efflux protein
MSWTALWPWVVLLVLGAFHGFNPGMGWLFAVALGLQERRRATVYRALGPIALGYALSITTVLGVVGGIQVVVSESIVHDVSAAVLGAFGLYRLIRS